MERKPCADQERFELFVDILSALYKDKDEKIKKGDKKGIRVKKNNPEVILKYNDINYAVLCDVLIGLCLELAVLWMYKMTICMLPSVEE